MNYITLALNILFFAFLGFGFLMGLKWGMKRTLVRTIWIILIVCLLIPISMNITSMILKINIPMSYGGQQCANIYEYLLTMFQDLIHVEGGNYSGLVDICIFLVSLVLNGLIYLLLYWIVKLLSLPLYWIINGFIFASERRKKRQAKKKKQKIKIKKHRFAGALIGTVLGLISFCMTITPVIGYVNLVNVVEKETQNEDGKGVLTQNIGDTYDQIMSAYNSSVPISAMNKIGMNKLLLTVFDGLTTSKISNKRIVLKDEAVSFSRIYNQASTMKMPDINTVSQDEFNTTLTSCDKLVELVFDSQLISATSDVIIPFGVAFARQSIDTSNFKPYVLAFYNVLFDEMEKLNSSSTEHEILSIIGLVKTLNNHNLLLPIIQTPEDLNVTYLQNHLTREASDEIVDSLFAISTVNNVAPALVNFLLGFGAEKLEYDYSSETAVTGEALKQSVSVLMGSVVDLLQNYDEGSSTKIKLNETTIGAVGGMLDEVKTILSVENFNSVVNALEPKLQDIVGSALSSSPEFMQNSVKEAIGNISEITSFKTTLLDVYDAVKVVENQFNDAKVNDKYDVQYMDFIKIGEAMDDIQNSGLFKDDLLLRTMEDAVEHFSVKVEDSVSTEEKPFELTVDTKIIANINELKGEGIEWQSELPKYKNTVGIFLNLFQTEDNLLEKLKSDADSTLEDLGVELDGDLKNSALFKDTDRLLVSDLLTLADIKVNSSEDEDLSTLLQDAKDNVLDESVAISWKDEFFHIKQLIKLEFEDTSDNSLLAIGEAIDKVTFDYDNGDRVVPKSTIFTQDMINKYISNYMDKVFENVTEESDFYSTINSIKSSFNTETITSYRLEIEALLKLKEVKSLVEESGFDFNSGEPKG